MIELKDIKLLPGMTDRDMAAIVKEIYPKHSNAIYSECKRGYLYGIDLRDDAKMAICKRLGISTNTQRKSRKIDRHILMGRITCRLPDESYRRFERVFEASGIDTKQDLIRPIIEKAIDREYDRLVKRGLIHEED